MMNLKITKNWRSWFGAATGVKQLGISLHNNALRVVQGQLRQQCWHYQAHHQLEINSEAEWPQALAQALQLYGQNCQCYLVLPSNRYQMLQIERPNVADEELAAALPWAVKDLITGIAVDDMVLDHLSVPSQTGPESSKINVVVCSKKMLRPLVELFHAQQVELIGIIPEELTQRNLVDSESHAVVTLTQQPNEELMLQVIKQQQVYIARKLRGFNQLADFSLEQLQQGVMDNVYLEIQRSLDYFGSQLKQAPVQQVQLALPTDHIGSVIEHLAPLINAKVMPLELNSTVVQLQQALPVTFYPALAGAVEFVFQSEVN